jgi:hypothetical protein
MGQIGDAYRILVAELEEKRLFGGPRCRWEHDS